MTGNLSYLGTIPEIPAAYLVRTLSITMGRPALIPESYIRKDLPININEEFPSLYMQTSLAAASVQFFNAVM